MFLLLEQALEESTECSPSQCPKASPSAQISSFVGFVSSLTCVSHDFLQRALSRKRACLAVETARSRVNYVESREQLPGCSPSCTVGKHQQFQCPHLSFLFSVSPTWKNNTIGDLRAEGSFSRVLYSFRCMHGSAFIPVAFIRCRPGALKPSLTFTLCLAARISQCPSLSARD